MINFLRTLFPFWLFTKKEPAASFHHKAAVNDPKTIVLPMFNGLPGKSYYDAVEMWSVERLRAKKLVLAICNDQKPLTALLDFLEHFACEFGTWLRFLSGDGNRKKIVDDLRMWHMHWHQGLEDIARYIAHGNFAVAVAIDMVKKKQGAWYYAGKKIDTLLKILWELEPQS